ncbi:hypothetical protein EMIT0P253_10211 [Pseudomonas sp. IT-P253]
MKTSSSWSSLNCKNVAYTAPNRKAVPFARGYGVTVRAICQRQLMARRSVSTVTSRAAELRLMGPMTIQSGRHN